MRRLARERFIVAAAAVYAVIAIWLFHRGSPYFFVDTADFRKLARAPLSTGDFWAGPRPPGYALLLKLLGPESIGLLRLQLAVYMLAFALVAWGLARRCTTPWVRTTAFTIVLYGSLSGGWFHWTHAFSTESLSLSLVVLAIGVVLVFLVDDARPRWQRRAAVAVVVVALAEWLALRDLDASWLVIATATAALLAFSTPASVRARRATAVAVALAVVAALVVGAGARGGRRWQFPFVNILAQRVLPDKARAAWWEQHGMPSNDQTRCFAGHWASDCGSDFSGFEPWLSTRGLHVYTRELVTHPRRLFVEPLEHWKALLCGDRKDEAFSPWLTFYTDTQLGPIRDWWTRIFLSKWKWLRSELVVALLFIVWARRRTRLGLDAATAPLVVLAATVYPLMILVWHGDAMEIQRHALIAMVSLRLALWGAFAITVDRLVQSYARARS